MQRTLKAPITARGIGLHSGNAVQITLHPAPVDHGIVFRRTDTTPASELAVSPEIVCETNLCTGLEKGGVRIQTVEHLMSALFGMGIDNVLVELDAPEVPIFDGSAAPFLYLIESAGVATQEKPKKIIKVMRTVEVKDGSKFARFKPDDKFSVTLEVDYNHPVIPRQKNRFEINGEFYRRGIARARTFCFQDDVEKMQQHGLALGGGLDNAIVIGDFSVINHEGLRFEDEFLRHKVLDCIGDLYMASHPIIGAYEARMTGHGLNNKLIRTLLANKLNWRFIEAPAESDILALSA